MYSVPDRAKALLKRDNTLKYLKITILDTGNVIPYANIESESLEWRQSLWDSDSFRFGGCISNYLSFSTLNYSEDLVGKEIKAEVVIRNTDYGQLRDSSGELVEDANGNIVNVLGAEHTSAYDGSAIDAFVEKMNVTGSGSEETPDSYAIPLGVFIVTQNELAANGVVRTVVAYDRLYRFRNMNILNFYTQALSPAGVWHQGVGTKVSLNYLLQQVWYALSSENGTANPSPIALDDITSSSGATIDMTATWLDFTSSNPYITDENDYWNYVQYDWDGITVLRDIFESAYSFGIMDREGNLSVVKRDGANSPGSDYGFKNAVETYTARMIKCNTLLSGEALKPQQVRLYETTYDNCAYLGQIPICTVYPNDQSGWNQTTIPPKTYAMKRNTAIRGMYGNNPSGTSLTPQRSAIAQTGYEILSKYFPYTNIKATVVGLPYVDVGDYVQFNVGGETVKAIIQSRTLKGIIGMVDTIETRFPSEYEQLTYRNAFNNAVTINAESEES